MGTFLDVRASQPRHLNGTVLEARPPAESGDENNSGGQSGGTSTS